MKNILNKNYLWVVAIIALIGLNGCVTRLSGNRYDRGAIGVQAETFPGLILGIEKIIVDGSRSGVGALAGGALGSQIGTASRYSGSASALIGIAGAVVGGALGSAAEEALTSTSGFRYTIRLEDGRTIVVVQADRNPVAQAGQHVQVVYGNQVRVIPAYQGLVYHP